MLGRSPTPPSGAAGTRTTRPRSATTTARTGCSPPTRGRTVPCAPASRCARSKDLVTWEFHGWALDGVPTDGAALVRRGGPVGARRGAGRRRVAHVLVGVDVRLPHLRDRAGRRAAPDRPVGGPRARGDQPARRRRPERDRRERRGRRRRPALDGLRLVLRRHPRARARPRHRPGPSARRPASCSPDGRAASRGRSRARSSCPARTAATRWSLSYDSLFSTYHVRVGVSAQLTGPYADRAGRDLTDLDGDPALVGTLMLAGHTLDGGRSWLRPGARLGAHRRRPPAAGPPRPRRRRPHAARGAGAPARLDRRRLARRVAAAVGGRRRARRRAAHRPGRRWPARGSW